MHNLMHNYDYLGCNIIGYSGGNISNGYIIDKGLNHGVEKDMVVITSVGLVGKVTKASSNFSIVQTILNENIAVAAMVERLMKQREYYKELMIIKIKI